MYRRARTPSIWREMDRMQQEMNQLFNFYGFPRTQAAPSFPAINLWADEESVILRAELPGVKVDDLDITVEEGNLVLSGNRAADNLPEDGKLFRQERGYGRFTRTVNLPFRVDQGKIEANLTNGILNLVLPRAEEDKPKKITVKS